MTKTRQEAIDAQKNPVIRAALQRMTDEQYQAHRAKMDRDFASGAIAREAARLVREIVR